MSAEQGSHPPLFPGQIQVWKASLPAWISQTGRFTSYLSGAERDRARRLKIPSKRQEFSLSRGLLRLILSTYLNVSPRSVEISLSPQGKPYLQNEEISFNLSHSGGILLIAIGLNPRLGIDVQEIYPITNRDRIIRDYFSPLEGAFLSKHPTNLALFFSLWTAKEAYLKALGGGFQDASREWSLIPDPNKPGSFQVLSGAGKDHDWSILEIKLGSGVRAAAAAEGAISQVQVLPLELDPLLETGIH